MSREDLKETFRQFDDLVVKATVIHPWTWCVRDQKAILTMSLKGEKCCPCRNFVVNGGICDPL